MYQRSRRAYTGPAIQAIDESGTASDGGAQPAAPTIRRGQVLQRLRSGPGAACAACGQGNPPGSRFCNACGQPLTAAGPRRRRRLAEPPSRGATPPRHLAEDPGRPRRLEGERKQVTVLFADVVGSTELIRDRDAEDAQRLLDGAVQRMMDAVHRYEGTVSRRMGDGLMAMFGAPVAHEDHAVRACYAALAMLEAVRALRRGGPPGARRRHPDPGRAQQRRGDRPADLGRPAHGLHRDGPDGPPGLADGGACARPGTALLSPATLALVEGFVEVRAARADAGQGAASSRSRCTSWSARARPGPGSRRRRRGG